MVNKKSFSTIKNIADEVIKEILNNNNPFVTPTVVFHNTKIAQWFKTYYLKTNDKVMMNVEFKTLSSFVNDTLKAKKDCEIMDSSVLRAYILKILCTEYAYVSGNQNSAINYIFNTDGSFNGINLYEFSDKLSSLFMNAELDNDDMLSWEKDIYNKVIEEAKKDNRYTVKSLFDSLDNTLSVNISGPVYIFDNSYITELYKYILNSIDGADINIYTLEIKDIERSCNNVFTAPSIVREVEALHTKICKLVHNEVKYNDVVVYVPKIDDYINTIKQVFTQDDKEFPSIPYTVVGASKEQKDMVLSLKVLEDIAYKHFFTRNDLKKFVNNSMIKYLWDITDQEIDIWMDAVIATNTYRNADKDNNDWNYLKTRLLLSVLVGEDSTMKNKTSVAGTDYIPYASMSLSMESVNKLIDIIDALLNWCEAFTDTLTVIDESNIDTFISLLDSLYSKKKKDGEESNYLYKVVASENELIKSIKSKLPVNTWLKLLVDSPKRYASHPANMFSGGVTFLSLSIDNIVYEPYTFILGLSSNNYPRVEIRSELEEKSLKHKTTEVLDEVTINAICNNSDNLVCSYVNRDLKKDTEVYPSSLLPNCSNEVEEIPLDEKRNYSDLFTKKEFVNKKYYDDLIGSDPSATKTVKAPLTGTDNIEMSVSLSQMKKFLESPFIFKYQYLFSKNNDKEDSLIDEYEPFDLDRLSTYKIIKDIIMFNDAEEKEINVLKHSLPKDIFGDKYFELCKDLSIETEEIIKTGYELVVLDPLNLVYTNPDNIEIKWVLNCNLDIYRKEESDRLLYIEPIDGKNSTKEKDFNNKYYLNGYVFSLMDVAQRKEDRKYNIVINVGETHVAKYSITPPDARELLNKIYASMFDFDISDVSYMDSMLLKNMKNDLAKADEPQDSKGKNKAKTITSYKQLIEKMDDLNSWKFFDNKNNVDTYEEFGKGDFMEMLKKAYDQLEPLILLEVGE